MAVIEEFEVNGEKNPARPDDGELEILAGELKKKSHQKA